MSNLETLEHELSELCVDYVPSEDVVDELRERNIVILSGPLAVGKTTTMQEVVAMDPDFGMTRGFTTRKRRPGEDPETYYFYEHEELNLGLLLEMGKSRRFVQITPHPSTGRFYGSWPDSYGSKYSLIDVVPSEVEALRQLPFNSHSAITLVSPPEQWWARVQERSALVGADDTAARLKEARSSIEWSLDQGDDVYWVVNADDKLASTAEKVIAYARSGEQIEEEGRAVGEQLLRLITAEL